MAQNSFSHLKRNLRYLVLTTLPRTYIQLMSTRSEEHTSELQSHVNLVCRLLLEKKNHRVHVAHPHLAGMRRPVSRGRVGDADIDAPRVGTTRRLPRRRNQLVGAVPAVPGASRHP